MEKGIERTCRAIKTRLIGRLSIRWAVISRSDPLWKPFKCQLIGVIVLEVTELLWYFRTRISGCLVPLIDKILLIREETAAT